MKTLIELYDERPLENVMSTEMFRPDVTVYICDRNTAVNEKLQRKLREYFRSRNIESELVFMEASHYSASSILKTLKTAVSMYPDCVLDISGGTDDALFAAGRLCSEKKIPVLTYSRKKNRYFSISSAPFADNVECDINYRTCDFFRMAGGAMRQGRVDNRILENYFDIIEPYFEVFMDFRRKWGTITTYFQRVSQTPRDREISLDVCGELIVKGDRGRRIEAPVEALRRFERIGMIRDLKLGDKVCFSFRDRQCRTWLRDVGSVLEIYIYKLCVDCGLYNDVHTSVVVDWEKDVSRDSVTNEIDVMAVHGVTPVFISCKTCPVSTEALNELAILRDRFGGKGACAAIVTTENGTAVMRNRAHELDIDVIELQDFTKGNVMKRIKSIVRNR